MTLDVIFISYDESNADENWNKLLERVPYAIRVHGIKGIAAAHKIAAEQASTSHFYCIDGDNVVDDSFNFDKIIDFQRADKRIHVWSCRNPVNGLTYGYGGVKLFPTHYVRNIETHSVDFCTSVASAGGGFRFHEQVASTTYFNTNKFSAWKSGFRECAKLASSIIDGQNTIETESRLKVWMSIGLDSPYGDFAIAGARAGALYGLENNENISALQKINDFDFCKKHYEEIVDVNNIKSSILTLGVDLSMGHGIPNIFFNETQSTMIKSVIHNL